MNAELRPRESGLGASDAAVALGLSPWKSPLELFLEKTGHAAEFKETLPIQVGRALEPVILRLFMEKTGQLVTRAQTQIVDPENDWRWVTIDGLVAAERALLEAKAISWTPGEWGEPGTDQVPMAYVVQCQHGLACARHLGVERVFVPVLFEAKRFEIYVVPRDDEIIAAITAQEREFMRRVWEQDAPPAISTADARLKYERSAESTVIADQAMLDLIALVKGQSEALDVAEKLHDETKAKVMEYMGESAILTDPDGTPLATWRTAKGRAYFDLEGFRRDHPSTCKDYMREGKPSRRFLVK